MKGKTSVIFRLMVFLLSCLLFSFTCMDTLSKYTSTQTLTNSSLALELERLGFRWIDRGTVGLNTGDTIYYGTYPQTRITNSTTISQLNSAAGAVPASTSVSSANSWKTYNYRNENGYYKAEDDACYMWYADVTLNGQMYRGVYFRQYRPAFIKPTNINNQTTNYTKQKTNGYSTGTRYWFRYDEIEWTVLTYTSGKLLLQTKKILDSQQFYYNAKTSTDNPSDRTRRTEVWADNTTETYSTYSNNYQFSDIRNWLNGHFYSTAFKNNSLTHFTTTLRSNSLTPTAESNAPSSTATSANKYAKIGGTGSNLGSTKDYVFLLSFQEAKNTNYGFKAYSTADSTRQKVGTDYAESQGLTVHSNGYSFWWLRSPHYELNVSGGDPSPSAVTRSYSDGKLGAAPASSAENQNPYYNTFCNETWGGVAPAIWVNLKTLEHQNESGHKHTYATATTVNAASCAEQSYVKHTCSCGRWYTDTYTQTIPHQYDENGTCTVCSKKRNGST